MTIIKILDNLYVGDRDSLFDPTQRVAAKINATLNCTSEIVATQIVSEDYLELPIHDSDWISNEYLKAGINFIDEHIKLGHNVLVACAAGISRSIGMIWAYMIKNGWDYYHAWSHIKQKRPAANPCFLIELSIKRFFGMIDQ